MIVGLMMGKKTSLGFPGKNLYPVLGKPLMTYPLAAALNTRSIDEVYVTTDDGQIKDISLHYGAKVIARPRELCTSTATGEQVFIHGYNWIKEHCQNEIEIIILLLANAATITSELIEKGIQALREDESLDSAVSVSKYNMWSPLRARKIDSLGMLKPFVSFEALGDPSTFNDNRDSQGDVYFADMGVSIVRPRCLLNIEKGLLPQRWMGQNIYPLQQEGGFDIDYEWQLPALEFWLKKNNVPMPEPKLRKDVYE